MTGCVWEMQIKYCYALNISWALQAWEKLNVLWLSQCLAPLPYYLYLISHICNYKRQMEQNCNKKNTREGWDVSCSFRAHTDSACAITRVLLHNWNFTQELKALWDSLGKEETKDPPHRDSEVAMGSCQATMTGQDPTPWQECRWHPVHSSSKEIQPRCLDREAGAPNRYSLQTPCAASGGFRDPPADSATGLSKKKSRRNTQAGDYFCTSQGTSKDRNTLVAFPNPSSSSISYTISCQNPKRQSSITSLMANMFHKEHSKYSLPVNQQGSHSTSPLAHQDCRYTADTFVFTPNGRHKGGYKQCLLMHQPQREEVLIIQSASSFVFSSTGRRRN